MENSITEIIDQLNSFTSDEQNKKRKYINDVLNNNKDIAYYTHNDTSLTKENRSILFNYFYNDREGFYQLIQDNNIDLNKLKKHEDEMPYILTMHLLEGNYFSDFANMNNFLETQNITQDGYFYLKNTEIFETNIDYLKLNLFDVSSIHNVDINNIDRISFSDFTLAFETDAFYSVHSNNSNHTLFAHYTKINAQNNIIENEDVKRCFFEHLFYNSLNASSSLTFKYKENKITVLDSVIKSALFNNNNEIIAFPLLLEDFDFFKNLVENKKIDLSQLISNISNPKYDNKEYSYYINLSKRSPTITTDKRKDFLNLTLSYLDEHFSESARLNIVNKSLANNVNKDETMGVIYQYKAMLEKNILSSNISEQQKESVKKTRRL